MKWDSWSGAVSAMLRGEMSPLSSAQLSRTINVARITLIIGLVFLHYHAFPNSRVSPFQGMDPHRYPLATFVNSFVLFFFFSAVPLLSMVSGWLFFSFSVEEANTALRTRISGRLRSLYLPMVFWNALVLLVVGVLFLLAPTHPLLQAINIPFAQASGMDYLNALFAVTGHPVAFQFWFVRDLFVTVLISPLLWWMLRRAPYLGLALLALAWMAGHDLWIFFRTDVVFFFALGGFIRLHRVPLEICRKVAITLLVLYLALVALRAGVPLWLELDDAQRPPLLSAATRAMRLLGVLACWGMLLQLAATPAGARIARFSGLAFFVYALHFPLIEQVKLVLWSQVPAHTDAWMIAHYLASVTLTCTIAIALAMLVERLAPRVFALMNGGRAGPARAA